MAYLTGYRQLPRLPLSPVTLASRFKIEADGAQALLSAKLEQLVGDRLNTSGLTPFYRLGKLC
jgi:hypothetical protein